MTTPTHWRRDPFGDDAETIYTEEPEVEAAREYHAAMVLQSAGNRSRRRISWFNVYALAILLAALAACLHEAGCLGK